MLQTNEVSTCLFYFIKIVMGCLYNGYIYTRYNPDLPLVSTRAQPPGFHTIYLIFLCNLAYIVFSH